MTKNKYEIQIQSWY